MKKSAMNSCTVLHHTHSASQTGVSSAVSVFSITWDVNELITNRLRRHPRDHHLFPGPSVLIKNQMIPSYAEFFCQLWFLAYQCFPNFLQMKTPFTAIYCLMIFPTASGNGEKLTRFNLWRELRSPKAEEQKETARIGCWHIEKLNCCQQVVSITHILLVLFWFTFYFFIIIPFHF